MDANHVLNSIEYDKVFIRNPDVVSRKIAGELFLVPVKGKIADMENIFTLASVAEYIWDRLDGKKDLNEILNDVMDRFDVEHGQAESDIREFIMELIGAGLITEKSI